MPIREVESADGERVREVASSAMSSAYAISPEQIETIVEAEFADETLGEKIESEETVLRVATASAGEADDAGDREEGDVIGVAEASVDGDSAEVRWIFVDPEFWELGYGTELFEAVEEGARERGADDVRGVTLTRNEQFGTFFERFGLEQVDDREVEIGGEEFAEHVYAESADGEAAGDDGGDAVTEARGAGDVADDEDTGAQKPSVDVPDETTVEDGTRVYVDRDDPISGIEGPFFQTFEDEAREEAYGYFCGNCGSTDVTMDNMGRMECGECGNQHRERDDYDSSYL